MKHNRIWICLVVALSISLLCGCMDVKNLSEEQADMVAEYSAGVLLRYSDKYEFRLITAEQIAKDKAEQEAKSGATATPDVSATPIPESTDEPDSPENQSLETTEPAEEKPEDKSIPLNDIYKISGLDFSYQSYEFCNEYPKNAKGKVIPAHAENDETLLVITFNVKNTSGADKTAHLSARNIQYMLNVDGSKIQLQKGSNMMVLSNGGLDYLDTKIKKNKSEKAILIYRLSKEREKATSIILSVEEDGVSSEIKLR